MKATDRLLPALIKRRLSTKVIARRVYYYPEMDSTNRAAIDLAKLGEPEGTLVITDSQTKGRGRRDHKWFSPVGLDLLFSLVLRPARDPRSALSVTLAVAVAVSEAVSRVTGCDVGVKWPNDVVAEGGKIGGILAEGSTASASSSYVVVGVGLNVNSTPRDFPEEVRGNAATCRTLVGDVVDRLSVLADVLASIEDRYFRFLDGGFAALRQSYLDRLRVMGCGVLFERAGERAEGIVVGVQDDGALLVRPAGDIDPVAHYGEVEWRKT